MSADSFIRKPLRTPTAVPSKECTNQKQQKPGPSKTIDAALTTAYSKQYKALVSMEISAFYMAILPQREN